MYNHAFYLHFFHHPTVRMVVGIGKMLQKGNLCESSITKRCRNYDLCLERYITQKDRLMVKFQNFDSTDPTTTYI
jgi:hypothetical protein